MPRHPLIDADSITMRFAPQRRDHIASAELDGEAVLYDEDTGAVHQLNPTATIVWNLIDGAVPLEELAGELAAAARADRDVVAADLLDLARELGGLGLLAGVAPDPGVAHLPERATDVR